MSTPNHDASYTTRLSEWASKQGVLFQFRHAAVIGGIGRPLLSLFIRVVILLIIVAIIFWLYLYNTTGRKQFTEQLQGSIEHRFNAVDVELQGVSRGNEGLFAEILEIGQMTMDAGDTTVFEPRAEESDTGGDQSDLEAVSVTLSPVNVTDGVFSPWKVNDINVGSLSAKLKIGGESKEEAERSHAWLFDTLTNTELRRFHVAETNLSWGYTSFNLGSISGSSLTGLFNSSSWNLTLADGVVNFNWLRNAKLVKANVSVTRETIVISDAALTMGSGVVKLDAVITLGKEPSVEGSISFKGIPVNEALRLKYESYIAGSVSGSGGFNGSLVASKGLNYTLNIQLEDTDTFELSDKIPVITALSVVDSSANYKNLSFSQGNFNVVHENGVTNFNDIRMQADNGIMLVGEFALRAPKEGELERDLLGEDSSEFEKEIGVVLNKKVPSDSDVDSSGSNVGGTLGLKSDKIQETLDNKSESANRFDELRNDSALQMKRLEVSRRGSDDAREYFKNIRRFDGEVKLGMVRSAFQSSERLKVTYPFDNQSRRHWVIVPLSGSVEEITAGTAQALYELGRRVRRNER